MLKCTYDSFSCCSLTGFFSNTFFTCLFINTVRGFSMSKCTLNSSPISFPSKTIETIFFLSWTTAKPSILRLPRSVYYPILLVVSSLILYNFWLYMFRLKLAQLFEIFHSLKVVVPYQFGFTCLQMTRCESQ